MGLFKNPHVEKAEQNIYANMEGKFQQKSEEELFSFTPFDEKEAEETGSSNYSYWRSTLQTFSKNKVAMFLLFLILLIVVFTILQPFIPGQ